MSEINNPGQPASISSVFGRTGAVVALANDYLLVRGRQTLISTDGITATLQLNGDSAGFTGSNTVIAPTATNGAGVGNFAGAINNVTGLSGALNYRTGRNIRGQFIVGPAGKITDERYWFCFTDQVIAVMGASDNPVGNYAGFRFSTIAGDTSYQCITKDGTTQTIVSSGVAPVANTPLNFAIVFNDAIPNVQFYINGVLVATITTHLPSASTNIRIMLTNECFASTTNNGMIFEQAYVGIDL